MKRWLLSLLLTVAHGTVVSAQGPPAVAQPSDQATPNSWDDIVGPGATSTYERDYICIFDVAVDDDSPPGPWDNVGGPGLINIDGFVMEGLYTDGHDQNCSAPAACRVTPPCKPSRMKPLRRVRCSRYR